MYLIDKVADIMIDTVVEGGTNKVNEINEEKKLKKMLEKSIENYNELQKIQNPQNVSECIIDKKVLEDLDKNLIMPNLTIEQLEKNLQTFFERCIVTDNKEKVNSMRKYICHSYKLYVAGFITMSQVDEDIHNVHTAINESFNEVSRKMDKTANECTNKVSDKIDKTENKIIKALQKMPQQQLIFIDELDNSRMFYYISMQLADYPSEEFLSDIANNIWAEEDIYVDENDLMNVNFNFEYPITQSTLKLNLKFINEKFSKEKVGILSITSHF